MVLRRHDGLLRAAEWPGAAPWSAGCVTGAGRVSWASAAPGAERARCAEPATPQREGRCSSQPELDSSCLAQTIAVPTTCSRMTLPVLQRRPGHRSATPRAMQRPSSRSKTARRSAAGTCLPRWRGHSDPCSSSERGSRSLLDWAASPAASCPSGAGSATDGVAGRFLAG
jgi:hypothetical protein